MPAAAPVLAASFTFEPAAPVIGRPVTFDGSGSTCPNGPCTYEWSDDGGTTRPIPPLWPLGTGQILQFTFLEAATKYVRLVVTDAAGHTATIEHNVVVERAPPRPTNTVLPSVTGSAVEGQALSAGNGTWTGSPTSYAYQWQDCNTSGEACSNISGANSSTYQLTAADVAHTVRAVVTASNAGGSTSASSAATGIIAAAPPPPPSPPVNTALPTLFGLSVEGQTKITTTGTWTGTPTSYAYQWQDCNTSGEACSNISGANSSTYQLTAADVGQTVRAVVMASNAAGSTSASSAATGIIVAPPPPPPVNTALPTLFGLSVEGQTKITTTGTWTGSPTSYAYQWQDCNTSGEACSNISGANSSNYTLTAGDVGHTVRVVVTASNAGGSTSASSAATRIIAAAPPPPTAPVNTALPTLIGSGVEGQTLTASNGMWSGNPTSYAYQWQDCNTSGASCSNISLSTSSTYQLTATDVGHTVRVVVTASNAGGSTSASSGATGVIAAAPPPPPSPPVNTARPTIVGSVVEGQTLSSSTGTWSGSPTSYAYQWQDCNTSGASCSNIVGATAGTRVLASSDVGHTVRVVIQATNAGGTGEATSEATAVVAAKEKGGTPENCFANPEGCGYPGPKDTGVENCSELPKSSGTKTITKPETIENTDINGYVVVEASGVTLNHDCIIFDGEEREGSAAVVLESGATGFTISNTTVRAENTTSESFEEALRNNHSDPGAVASKDRLEDCAECIHQSWTLTESYVISNGRERADENGTGHTEDWWFSNNTITANDDTLLNPSKQTAIIFAESGGGICSNHEIVTNSLLAGGGSMFYFCAHSTGAGSSSIEIRNNRFARMVCTKKEIQNYQGRGGFGCSPEEGGYFAYGEGTGGYFPRGGFFGVVSEGEGIYNNGAGWEGNFWDNNLETVGRP